MSYFNSFCLLCLGSDQLIVLDFLAILLSLFAPIYSGMQADPEASCEELEKLPTSIDTSDHVELKHVRGFIERDLRPASLWTKSTSLTCIPSDSVGAVAASSSNDVAPDDRAFWNSSYDPIELLRPSDIENNVGFFLGPPGPMMLAVPSSRPFSKVASLVNLPDYDPAWLVAVPKANSAPEWTGLNCPYIPGWAQPPD